MNPSESDQLRNIKSFPSLVRYLRDELGWPVESDDFEELTYDYEPEELGLDAKAAVKIKEIKQLRPLSNNQPFGIFFINFDPKRLPVVVLRRILRALVIKKRTSANKAQQAAWAMNDLLFISSYGESEDRTISFAHFRENETDPDDLPTLRVLGWDGRDTGLHLDHAQRVLRAKLQWPNDDTDTVTWKREWSSTFDVAHREVITTAKALAVRLADLARNIRNRVNAVLAVESPKGPIRKLHAAFKETLIHDLSEDDFADMYAQTIAYGLLSARVARPEGLAAENLTDVVYVPNPFLQDLLPTFLQIGGRKRKGATALDFDELGVSDVVEVLRDANMEAVLRDFGDKNPQEDPVIHFYEDFLREYDPQKRTKRGVFYTPRPVVSFIVRSVHELLQTEFGLEDGLADTMTWGEMLKRHPEMKLPTVKVATRDSAEYQDQPIDPNTPFVQILDPATGTATFLVEAIDVIYKTLHVKWTKQGLNHPQLREAWNEYVPKHLLPRLYGYELMMAPYAIAHMKIGLKLQETGYRFASKERIRVYLTNALEPAQDFSDRFEFDVPALAHEAQAVNMVKRNQRFAVVIGNPPYANFGQLNKNPFILELLEDYKRSLGEKKINLDDDFIKFLRCAQWTLQCTNVGIAGMITNNTYVDGITHRRMRESLTTTFERIFIVDLHGNLRKQETAREGGGDSNVFDIQQGVAVGIFVKNGDGDGRRVFHVELWGNRQLKYDFLGKADNRTTAWKEVHPQHPHFFLVPKETADDSEYKYYFPINKVMPIGTSAVQTKRDALFVDFERRALCSQMADLLTQGYTDKTAERYPLEPSAGWSADCLAGVEYSETCVRPYLYRPFDLRHIYYDDRLLGRSRKTVFRHLLNANLALATLRQTVDDAFRHVFCTRNICDINLVIGHHVSDRVFPLYLYHEHELHERREPQPNISSDFLRVLSEGLNLRTVPPPEDIFHYAYAVFYSPAYRSRYVEFLRIDFPRLPLTQSLELFGALSKLGGELVALHLMESPKLDRYITNYVGSANPTVEKVSYSNETVWVDKAQTCGFRGVPEAVWDFHIGGYQVCEKWLKDRKGRTLSKEDIDHYQRIVVALNETIRLMKEIDEVIEQHGGWPGAFVTEPIETKQETGELPFA